MTTRLNDFETGSNGVLITPANSAGTGEQAFAGVLQGNSSTESVAYSTTHVAHGAMAAKLVTLANDLTVAYFDIGSSPAQVWFRFYLYMTANPTGASAGVFTNAGGSSGVKVTTSGFLLIKDDAANTQTGAVAVSLNQWVRVEGYFKSSATVGQAEVKLFNTAGSSTPDETVTGPASWNIGVASLQNPGIGTQGAAGPPVLTFWADDFATSDTAYIGPVASGDVNTTGVPAAVAAQGGTGVAGLNTTIAYATSYATGSGAGSWVNPGNAENAPDGAFATWTAP